MKVCAYQLSANPRFPGLCGNSAQTGKCGNLPDPAVPCSIDEQAGSDSPPRACGTAVAYPGGREHPVQRDGHLNQCSWSLAAAPHERQLCSGCRHRRAATEFTLPGVKQPATPARLMALTTGVEGAAVIRAAARGCHRCSRRNVCSSWGWKGAIDFTPVGSKPATRCVHQLPIGSPLPSGVYPDCSAGCGRLTQLEWAGSLRRLPS